MRKSNYSLLKVSKSEMAGKELTFVVEVMEITEAAEDSHCCSDPGCSSNQ